MIMQGIYINKDSLYIFLREKIKKIPVKITADTGKSLYQISGMKCRNLKGYKIPDTTG